MTLREKDLQTLHEVGFIEVFKLKAREVASLDMYHSYYEFGWTPKLARQVRRQLAPSIVQAVAMAWYSALEEAQATPKAKQ